MLKPLREAKETLETVPGLPDRKSFRSRLEENARLPTPPHRQPRVPAEGCGSQDPFHYPKEAHAGPLVSVSQSSPFPAPSSHTPNSCPTNILTQDYSLLWERVMAAVGCFITFLALPDTHQELHTTPSGSDSQKGLIPSVSCRKRPAENHCLNQTHSSIQPFIHRQHL